MAQLDTGNGEKVIFSCIVVKFNRWGMRQDRFLLLTNQYLYNIKKDNVQRKISIGSIKAMTKSTKEDNTEFIVHVRSEYDYHFECDKRTEIFNAVKFVYHQENNSNLPVYGVPDKLKHYATSKKDISNGYEVDPKEQFRLKNEDHYPESGSGAAVTQLSNAPSDGGFDEISQWN